MKKLAVVMLFFAVSLNAFFFSQSSADNSENDDNQHWHTEKVQNELFDRQKALLSKHDELDYRIQDLKRKIKFYAQDLEDAQNEMDQVQHELVIMRVKLLP